jgi:hypothetical protein
MTRNIKVLGLAIVAALALTAVMASAAQATTTFTAGSSSGKIEAVQTTEQVFTTTSGTVRCTGATQVGSFTTASFTSLTVTPSYSGCKAFGFLSATVDTEGCTYTFTGNASGSTANVDINCPAGKEIHVTTSGCVLHVPAQTNVGHVGFKSNTSQNPDDVDAEATLTGIKYTATSGCLNPATNEPTGTLSGGATIKAFNTSGTQVNLTVDA